MKKSLILVLLLLGNSSLLYCQNFDNAYSVITPPLPTETNNKIEVLEIFWYGCPHCYAFEPYLRQWLSKKPADVEFHRVPGILGNNWVPHAKAYYIAEKLGILDKMHQRLFDAIHKDRQSIFSDDEIKAFFIAEGVDEAKFNEIYDSKELLEKLRKAFELQQKARITGVPSVIINGKYQTSPTLAGSHENTLKVLDYLVDKEREGSRAP